MSLPGKNLSGIFYCEYRPNTELWTINDTIFIYEDESQRLSFNLLYVNEDNYSRAHTFEEGFVRQESTEREVHFEVRRRYEMSGGGGMGYDVSGYCSFTFQPLQSLQTYRVLDQTEITRLIEEGRVSERAEVVLFEPVKALVYEKVDGDENAGYRSAESLKSDVVATRSELHNHWQDMIDRYVRAQLAKGVPPEEIAERCDWTIASIQALSKQL